MSIKMYQLGDGEYTFVDELKDFTVLEEIQVNPKLVIRKVKLGDEEGNYYVVGNILIRDEIGKVERIPEMLFKAIELKLKRKEKVDRVKMVTVEKDGYVFHYSNERKVLAETEAQFYLKIGGEKVFFPIFLGKNYALVSFNAFNKLFFKKIMSLYRRKEEVNLLLS